MAGFCYEPPHFTLSTTFWALDSNLSNVSGGPANQIITVSPFTSSRTNTLPLLTSLKYAAASSLLCWAMSPQPGPHRPEESLGNSSTSTSSCSPLAPPSVTGCDLEVFR